MEKYSFLLKPIFFIFSLLFATWLVVEIEKISPSDFGEYESYVSQEPYNPSEHFNDSIYKYQSRKYLKSICDGYKAGVVDSVSLDKKLHVFLETTKSALHN